MLDVYCLICLTLESFLYHFSDPVWQLLFRRNIPTPVENSDLISQFITYLENIKPLSTKIPIPTGIQNIVFILIYWQKKAAKQQPATTLILIGSIIHKSDAPTQHWLFFITNNQSCLPVNPEIGRKISYIEVYIKANVKSDNSTVN